MTARLAGRIGSSGAIKLDAPEREMLGRALLEERVVVLKAGARAGVAGRLVASGLLHLTTTTMQHFDRYVLTRAGDEIARILDQERGP